MRGSPNPAWPVALLWLVGSVLFNPAPALGAEREEREGAEPEEQSHHHQAARHRKRPDRERRDRERVSAEGAGQPGEGERNYPHGGQFGLRAGLVGGYRMLFRYDESPFCKVPDPEKELKDQQKFCGHPGPLAIELGLSFAPLSGVEPFLWGRFGLVGESQTDTKPLLILGAGTRLYTLSDSALKVFIEPAVGCELEGGRGSSAFHYQGFRGDYKADLIFHVAAGPQIDLARGVGLYLDGGLTVGVLRYIQSTLELQGGIQGRLP